MTGLQNGLASLIALVALAGCLETRPLDWQYDLGGTPLGPDEVLAATIREDGCAIDDRVFFFGQLGDRTYDVPVIEYDDTYCFEILVVDVDTCLASRGSQETRVLDDTREELTVVNEIAPFPTPIACADTCVSGVGCLRCPFTMELCSDNAYCCNTESLCDDPELFSGSGSCVPIR